MANYQRITAPEVRAKSQQVQREMLKPRCGFVGCVATKTDPKVFKECAETYNNPEYQSLDLVPSAALKQSAFNKTGSVVLAPKQGVCGKAGKHGKIAIKKRHSAQESFYLIGQNPRSDQ